MYTLLYASEALPFNSSQLKSPPKHILFKMFKTGSSDIVSQCQELFNFPDVSELLFRRKLLHMKQWRYTDPCISSDHRRLRSRQHKPYTGMSRSWSRHTSRSHHTAYFDIDQLFSHSDFLKRNADYITKLSLKDRHHSRITVHSAVTTLQNDASNFPSVSIIIYTMCLKKYTSWCLIITLANVDRSAKVFTSWFVGKLSMYVPQRFLPHLPYVATLPCKIRKSKKVTEFSHST